MLIVLKISCWLMKYSFLLFIYNVYRTISLSRNHHSAVWIISHRDERFVITGLKKNTKVMLSVPNSRVPRVPHWFKIHSRSFIVDSLVPIQQNHQIVCLCVCSHYIFILVILLACVKCCPVASFLHWYVLWLIWVMLIICCPKRHTRRVKSSKEQIALFHW